LDDEVLAVFQEIDATPKGQGREADGIHPLRQERKQLRHVPLAVELVDVHLPEVVAGGATGVGKRHLVLFARPEAVGMSLVLRGYHDQLPFRVLLALETAQHLEGAVGGVPVGSGHHGGGGAGPLDHDDLMRPGIEGPQGIAQERLAVQNDHPEGYAYRVVSHAE